MDILTEVEEIFEEEMGRYPLRVRARVAEIEPRASYAAVKALMDRLPEEKRRQFLFLTEENRDLAFSVLEDQLPLHELLVRNAVKNEIARFQESRQTVAF